MKQVPVVRIVGRLTWRPVGLVAWTESQPAPEWSVYAGIMRCSVRDG